MDNAKKLTRANEDKVEEFARELAKRDFGLHAVKVQRELFFRERAYDRTSLELYISPLPKEKLFSMFQKRGEISSSDHSATDIDYLVADERRKTLNNLASPFRDVMRKVIGEESSEPHVFVGDILTPKGYAWISNPTEFYQHLNEGLDCLKSPLGPFSGPESLSFEIWNVPPIDKEERIDHVNMKCSLASSVRQKFKGLRYKSDASYNINRFSPIALKIRLEPVSSSSWNPAGEDYVQCYKDVIHSAYVDIIQSALERIKANMGDKRIILVEELEEI